MRFYGCILILFGVATVILIALSSDLYQQLSLPLAETRWATEPFANANRNMAVFTAIGIPAMFFCSGVCISGLHRAKKFLLSNAIAVGRTDLFLLHTQPLKRGVLFSSNIKYTKPWSVMVYFLFDRFG